MLLIQRLDFFEDCFLTGNSVSSIGNKEFVGCSSLLQITNPSSVQNTASLVFGCDPMLLIHIPQSFKDAAPFSDIDKYEINELTSQTYAHTIKSLTKKPKKNSCLLLMMKINQIAENWVDFFISR